MSILTVVTAYYNREDSVYPTLESIRTQSFKDFQCIVINDCSTDGTGDRIQDFLKTINDDRFVYVNNKTNQGLVKSFIDVLNSTESRYVAIVGSGDRCLPERFSRQFELLESDLDLGLVGSYFFKVNERGDRIAKVPKQRSGDFSSMVQKNWLSHGEVMFRRSVYQAAGGYRQAFKYSQDYDLWLRMIRLSRFGMATDFLYERSFQPDGVSFNAAKFPVQAKYSVAARNIALSDDPNNSYRELLERGVDQYVRNDDATFQNKLSKTIARNIAWGNTGPAMQANNLFIISRFNRIALHIFGVFGGTWIGRQFLRLVARSVR
ncbi:MAG: glycosyltransferase family 2 protein [Caulobacteraceae bacterium]|nr:glycosyltransferase family 2 protein [Caulobacteraceae bacterium]